MTDHSGVRVLVCCTATKNAAQAIIVWRMIEKIAFSSAKTGAFVVPP